MILAMRRNHRRMTRILKHIKPAKMRGPEVALIKPHLVEPNRIAHHIPGLFREGDHVCNQHIIKPAIRLGPKFIHHRGQLLRIAHCACGGIRLHFDPANIEQPLRRGHIINAVDQFPGHRIPRGQGKKLRFVLGDELLQDAARG